MTENMSPVGLLSYLSLLYHLSYSPWIISHATKHQCKSIKPKEQQMEDKS